MDRKSNQKIIYCLLVLIIVLLVGLFSFSLIYESKIRGEQLQELIIIYPEIEAELYENFLYYKDRAARLKLIAEVSVICLTGLLYFILLLHKKREDAIKIYEKEIDLIYEQLLRFQKGDFELLTYFSSSSTLDKLNNIHGKLGELGYYFSDLKERLKEEENNTKTLITDISHQLKTPLASIRICHDLAKSTDLSEEERKDFLKKEAQEIEKMEVLLDELVKLSRLENNMIQIKPEKNSLKDTISEAVSQIFMKAYAKHIEISVDMKEDKEILHDRKWTVEAIVNILENAVKYSDFGTTVEIRVSELASNILIEIEDEGIGIKEEEIHKIFKRFYRGRLAKERVKEGAGVGLYLARNIIEQQGGTIIAKRKPEKGTVFKIMLPL